MSDHDEVWKIGDSVMFFYRGHWRTGVITDFTMFEPEFDESMPSFSTAIVTCDDDHDEMSVPTFRLSRVNLS